MRSFPPSREDSRMKSHQPATDLLHPAMFTKGPLQKNLATLSLEKVMADLSNLDCKAVFSMDIDGLLLTIQDSKSSKNKKHYINLLLQSANLTHINVENFFLDHYLSTLNSTKIIQLKIASQQEFTKFADQHHSPFDEQKDITFAHKYAIYNYAYYALLYDFNNFLRGDFKFLSEIAKKHGTDSDYFQSMAFYIFSTLLITANFLIKSSPEKDKPYTISAAPTYRIQFHDFEEAKTVGIIKGVEEAKIQKTSRFVIKEPSFTSTSLQQFALETKIPPITYLTTKKIIAIRYADEPKKLIDTLSFYSTEKEILLQPSNVQYAILAEEKPFILLDAKAVVPLNINTDDRYMVQHALRHIFPIVSQEYKDSKIGDLDHQKIMDINHPPIQRPNHGAAHAARKIRNLRDIFEYLLEQGHEEAKTCCYKILYNSHLLNLVEAATPFLAAGRENEKSGDEDPVGYTASRVTAKLLFQEYIQEYYDFALEKGSEFEKIYQYCCENIRFLGYPEHLTNLAKKYQQTSNSDDYMNLVIYHLLTATQVLETPRCLDFKTCERILNDRLFAKEGGLVAITETSSEALKILWEQAIARIKKTGDRVIGKQNYQAPFYEVSTSPTFCEQILELNSKNKIVCLTEEVNDVEKRHRRNETAANLLAYLYHKSENPNQQIEHIKTFLNLLQFTFTYLKVKILPDKNIIQFMHAMQESYINNIISLLQQNMVNTTLDVTTVDEIFKKHNIDLFISGRYIEYECNETSNKFYSASLDSKQQEQLKMACHLGNINFSLLSPSLKVAILEKIIHKEQISLSAMFNRETYKKVFQWIMLDDFITNYKKITPALRQLMDYIVASLNHANDRRDEIIKKIDDPNYLRFIQHFKEALGEGSSRLVCYLDNIEVDERLKEYQIITVVDENQFIEDEIADREIIKKYNPQKNSKRIICYQSANIWYVAGISPEGEFIKHNIDTECFDIPSIGEAFYSFNHHLINKFSNHLEAFYNMGICYEKGLGCWNNNINAFLYFKMAKTIKEKLTESDKLPLIEINYIEQSLINNSIYKKENCLEPKPVSMGLFSNHFKKLIIESKPESNPLPLKIKFMP
jgi:hypothetical protein